MTDKNEFRVREAAFEAEYFRRKDAQLVDNLKAVFHKSIDKQSIRETTGITDEALLDRLVELNLNGELMAAFQLLPAIEVAWADGDVDERERNALLTAIEQQGVAKGSAAYRMIESRLIEPPLQEARKLWYMYAEALKKALPPEQLKTFRDDLLDLCRRVATASGGLLNIAFQVSPDEKKVLNAVERALTP